MLDAALLGPQTALNNADAWGWEGCCSQVVSTGGLLWLVLDCFLVPSARAVVTFDGGVRGLLMQAGRECPE